MLGNKPKGGRMEKAKKGIIDKVWSLGHGGDKFYSRDGRISLRPEARPLYPCSN